MNSGGISNGGVQSALSPAPAHWARRLSSVSSMATLQPIDALMGVKENVKPIKSGRSNLDGVARAFGQPLAPAAPAAEWEKRVAAAASTADPLAVWKECVG